MTFIPLYSYNDTLFLSNKNLRLSSLESSLLSFLSTSNQIATKSNPGKIAFLPELPSSFNLLSGLDFFFKDRIAYVFDSFLNLFNRSDS